MTRTRITCCLIVCLAIAGCARREDPEGEGTNPQIADTSSARPESMQSARAPLDKVVAGVDVSITLTPDAAAELKNRGETLVIEATYAGDPTPESSSQVNEFGLVELGSDTRELTGAGQVSFDEDVIDKSRLPLIAGQPQIMLNVRSARKRTPTNILACDLFWDSVEAASAATVEIQCGLLNAAE